jgi:hypothetical protein
MGEVMRDMERTKKQNSRFILLVSMLVFFVTFIVTLLGEASDSKEGSWEIWIVPSKYTVNIGETLDIVFGLTGYGDLDPMNLKVVAYTEGKTLIRYGNSSSQFDTYLIAPNDSAPKDRFKSKLSSYPNNILLKSDYNSDFGHLFLTPSTHGDKKLTLIATYSTDGQHWKTTSRELNYHVNSWSERYQTWLAVIGVTLAFLAIGPGPLLKWLWGRIPWNRMLRKELK